MKTSDPFNHQADDAWMDGHIEAYLDGDLTDADRVVFEQGLAEPSEWDTDRFLARQIWQGFETLHDPYCPDHVVETVFAETRRRTRAARRYHLNGWFEQRWTDYWQPALAMTVLLLVVISAALLGQPPQSAEQRAEVEAAVAEVQWTLAYLSEVGRHTGETVRQEVLEDHIVAPVHHAISPLLTAPPSN